MRINIHFLVGLILIFCACFTFPVYSQNNSILQLADQYSFALKRFQAQKKRTSVEGLIRKGNAIAEKFREMESLNEADYTLLKKKMKGFVVNRDEILYIEPDTTFFARLSKKRGVSADVAFFDLLREIKPDNVWAAYIEPQTDVTGCTIYGNGILTRLYGKGIKYKKTYPKAFTKDIDDEISEIMQAFSESSCACGTMGGVQKEFRLFIKSFPNDKNTLGIKKNLKDLIKRGDFRFNCKSG